MVDQSHEYLGFNDFFARVVGSTTANETHIFAPLLGVSFGCVAILGRLSTSCLLSRHHFTIHTRNQPTRDHERRCSFVLCRQDIVRGGDLSCAHISTTLAKKNRYSREIQEVAPRWINLMNISALTIFFTRVVGSTTG